MKIYCDYDSCLNNLGQEWAKWVNRNYGSNIVEKDILHWDWIEHNFGVEANNFWKDPNIYKNDIVLPLRGAEYFVKKMQHVFGEKNISIITYSWPGTEKEKDKHIKRHFGFINIVHHADKYQLTHDGILIDDKPESVINHCLRNNQCGIIFTNNDTYSWSIKEKIKHYDKVKTKLRIKKTYEEILSYLMQVYYMGDFSVLDEKYK